MLLKVFALYDVKSGAYGTPFFLHHVGEAVRACIDLGGDLNTIVGRHPADFALHELGSFDTETGLLVGGQPVSHGAVVTFLPKGQPLPLLEPQVPRSNGFYQSAPEV